MAKIFTIGDHHQIRLAVELYKHGLLEEVFSGYPAFKFGQYPPEVRDKIRAIGFQVLTRPVQKSLPRHWQPYMDYWVLEGYRRYIRHQYSCQEKGGVSIVLSHLLSGELCKDAKESGETVICDVPQAHTGLARQIIEEEARYMKISRPTVTSQKAVEAELSGYEESDLLVVPSYFVRDSLESGGISREKIRVVPYGTKIVEASHERIRTMGGRSGRILFVGEVSIRKGVYYLMKAFKRLNYNGKRLDIVGNIDRTLMAIVEREGLLTSGVKLWGEQPRSVVEDLMDRSDIFCLPSLCEGQAMVLGEAAARGCSLVATKESGYSPFLSEDCIYEVKSRDAESIKKAITEILDDSGTAANKERLAYSRIHCDRGWTAYGEKWKDLVKLVMGS